MEWRTETTSYRPGWVRILNQSWPVMFDLASVHMVEHRPEHEKTWVFFKSEHNPTKIVTDPGAAIFNAIQSMLFPEPEEDNGG